VPFNDIAALALLVFGADRPTIVAALAGACALPVVRFGDDRLDPAGAGAPGSNGCSWHRSRSPRSSPSRSYPWSIVVQHILLLPCGPLMRTSQARTAVLGVRRQSRYARLTHLVKLLGASRTIRHSSCASDLPRRIRKPVRAFPTRPPL